MVNPHRLAALSEMLSEVVRGSSVVVLVEKTNQRIPIIITNRLVRDVLMIPDDFCNQRLIKKISEIGVKISKSWEITVTS